MTPPPPRDALRGAPIVIGGILAATTAMLLVAMAWLNTRVPAVPDLYNLVYANNRPRKGESTAMFLFVFPVMCAAFSVALPYILHRARDRSERYRLVNLAFALLIFSVLVIGAVSRFRVVRDFYGV